MIPSFWIARGKEPVVKLYSKSPLASISEIEIGTLKVEEVNLENIMSVQPFKGKGKLVSKALNDRLGVGLPEVGKSINHKNNTVMWIGMNQFLLIGKKIEIKGAALTDQSDAWAVLSLTGKKTSDVMDRLCPVDTRALQSGDIVRSMIGHMSAIIEKTDSGCKLMVFRAFARTLLHEVCNSMKSVIAQEKLKDTC